MHARLSNPCFLFAFLTALLSESLQADAPQAVPVSVSTVRTGVVKEVVTLLGTTEPRRASTVAASIEGQVIDYPAREGLLVKEGDVLARLRDDILKLQLWAAQASLAEFKEWHRKAKLDLERAERLILSDAVTPKELDAAVTEERALSHRVPRAEAEAAVLEANIEKKVVRAPFAGVVVRELSEVGEWLPAGGAVARLVDLSWIYVRLHVPERHIRHIQEGSRVEVDVPAAGEEPFEAVIVSIGGEGDAAARTFPVRLKIVNDGRLRAGMSARVHLAVGEERRVLVVEKDAVLREGDGAFVFVVSSGRAERRAVRLGRAQEGRFEIIAGLEAGEQVVVRGNERLQPGAGVRLVSPESEKAGS
jgi:RND family efflux transporter MFP subunit